jgi:hypothetical protein
MSSGCKNDHTNMIIDILKLFFFNNFLDRESGNYVIKSNTQYTSLHSSLYSEIQPIDARLHKSTN